MVFSHSLEINSEPLDFVSLEINSEPLAWEDQSPKCFGGEHTILDSDRYTRIECPTACKFSKRIIRIPYRYINVTVMTHVIALKVGQSSLGTLQPITPENHSDTVTRTIVLAGGANTSRLGVYSFHHCN